VRLGVLAELLTFRYSRHLLYPIAHKDPDARPASNPCPHTFEGMISS
jgi:hypothetical protein